MIRAIIMILFGASMATASDLSITGYAKNFFVVYDAPSLEGNVSYTDPPLLGSVTNRVRLNAFYSPNDWLSMSLSYNILPRIQDPSLFETSPNFAELNFPSYRFADLDSRIYPDEEDQTGSFGLYQNLDRFSITVRTPTADIFFGRQAIAWGSGHAVNPTDVLTPFTFDELDTEDRPGVDAIRVRVPVGRLEEIDAGYVFGDDFDFDESAFFLRGTFRAFRTDISPTLIGFRENLLLGTDLSRAIGGASGWLEAAYVFIDALDDRNDGEADDYLRASIGADYALTGELYGFVEYHYSGAGAGDPDEYLARLTDPAFTDGAVYLLGRHYLIPGFSYQIMPLVGLSGQFLTNLEEPSILLAPYIEYNIAENIYLAGGAFIGLGERSQVLINDFPGVTIRYRSEFGSYSDLYYTSFRIYF
jgi:hypothetical protein